MSSTLEHLGSLKADELRTIIRSLKLKTSVKGYSKMRHSELISELDKLISVTPDNGELLINLRTPPPATDSLRITLNVKEKKPAKEVEPSVPAVAAGAITTPKKTRSKVDAPAPAPAAEVPQTTAIENLATDTDDDAGTTSVGNKKVKAPPQKKGDS